MATSVVPALIDALVTNAAAVVPANTLVFDGLGITADPGSSYLMVGVDDVDSTDKAFAADSTQTWANANYTARDEEGHIVCAAVAWNGDGDQKAARDKAYAIAASVENMLRANPSQGVANLLWSSFGSRSQLSQDQQATAGALAILVFRIHFRARI